MFSRDSIPKQAHVDTDDSCQTTSYATCNSMSKKLYQYNLTYIIPQHDRADTH